MKSVGVWGPWELGIAGLGNEAGTAFLVGCCGNHRCALRSCLQWEVGFRRLWV